LLDLSDYALGRGVEEGRVATILRRPDKEKVVGYKHFLLLDDWWRDTAIGKFRAFTLGRCCLVVMAKLDTDSFGLLLPESSYELRLPFVSDCLFIL